MRAAAIDDQRTGQFDTVHADLLRCFPELVRELGGDPAALLNDAGIDPEAPRRGAGAIGYRQVIALLDRSAARLGCPDLGMRLAARQRSRIAGPFGTVFANSRTLGDALDYASRHAFAHSLAARIRLVPDAPSGTILVAQDLLVDGETSPRQAIEQLLLLGHLTAIDLTGGWARGREIRFRHQPLAPLAAYRRHFGCGLRFGEQVDGIVFSQADLSRLIVDRDADAARAAATLIAERFVAIAPPLHAQVRALLADRIGSEECGNEIVAAALNLHPRTLHRRLRAEGRSFQSIKDQVRREAALRLLLETDLDLTRIAQRLGYAEHSVFTRSCARWFGGTPSRLRANRAGSIL